MSDHSSAIAAVLIAGEAEPVAAVARGCTFWDFSLSTSWFYAVAWDLGLAVLAATDTG